MREILFRGKLKCNGEWSYGNLIIRPNTISLITPDDTPLGRYGEVDPETVGQYTGLTDRNGKKIFEGDIVDYEDEVPGQYEYHDSLFINRGVVEYSEGCFYWTNGVAAENLVDCVYKGVADCVVIGNIHDNPELREDEER